MTSKLTKTAAVLAFIIGAMAILAGRQILLGKVMDYYVIGWLPTYNLVAGIISAFFTAVLIWKGSKLAMPSAIATFLAHSLVMVIIQTSYQNLVATDSILAMIFRMVVWLVIISLMLFHRKNNLGK